MAEVNDGWEGMNKCPYCGNYNSESNLFCEWCNQRIRWTSADKVEEKDIEYSLEDMLAMQAAAKGSAGADRDPVVTYVRETGSGGGAVGDEYDGFLKEWRQTHNEKKPRKPKRPILKAQSIPAAKIICWHCRAESPVGSTYCFKCGNQLDPGEKRSFYCCFCGKVNAWNAVYCHECGKKFPRGKNGEWQNTDSG